MASTTTGVIRGSSRENVTHVVLVFLLLTLKACNFIKKETLAQVFSCEFPKIFKNTFFHLTPLVAAFEGLLLVEDVSHGFGN